jgi:hypothetical protein
MVLSKTYPFILCFVLASNSEQSFTGGVGIDIEFSEPFMGRLVLPYYNVTSFPLKAFDCELDATTIAFNRSDSGIRVAVGNSILSGIAWGFFYFNHKEESFWGFGPIGALFAAPQVLGNFKLHYRVVSDVFHVYIGQATDYYFLFENSYIYTESKVGIKLMVKSVAVDISICKPWLKGPLETDKFFFSVQLGTYFSNRKK